MTFFTDIRMSDQIIKVGLLVALLAASNMAQNECGMPIMQGETDLLNDECCNECRFFINR